MNRVLKYGLSAGLMVLLVTGTALAAELIGTVAEVDTDARKIVVVSKKGGERVEVTITDETEWVNPKGKTIKKYDLSKLKEREGKARVKVEHENKVASKITFTPAKKKADQP